MTLLLVWAGFTAGFLVGCWWMSSRAIAYVDRTLQANALAATASPRSRGEGEEV